MPPDEWDYRNRPMPPSAYRGPTVRSVTFWLIAINCAVYLIDRILWKYVGVSYVIPGVEMKLPPLTGLGHYSEYMVLVQLEVWRVITYQFIHGSMDHLIFNMIALYFFGPLVEAYFTPRIFLVFYLLCGVGGAGMYELLLRMGWPIGETWFPLMGASGAIFGILIASARIAPEAEAFVFGVFPLRLRTLAYIFIGYAIFSVLFRSPNAGGQAAHLGGAAVGYLLIEWTPLLERLAYAGRRAPPF
jgi:membrane associated rhomboid family serine protease